MMRKMNNEQKKQQSTSIMSVRAAIATDNSKKKISSIFVYFMEAPFVTSKLFNISQYRPRFFFLLSLK